MADLRRALEKLVKNKQDALMVYPAKMGNESGQVIAGAGLVYVRIEDVTTVAACSNVPPVYNLDVWVGYDQIQSNILRVIGQREFSDGQNLMPSVPAHAEMHTFLGAGAAGGTDVIKVQLQQFMPLAVWPYQGFKVIVYPGLVWVNNQYKLIADLNVYQKPIPKIIDFTEYPAPEQNKEMYYLIGIDNTGNIQVVGGNQVDWGTITLNDIPARPETMVYTLAAVRRTFDQTSIVINRESTDIVDLRFPMRHRHTEDDLPNNALEIDGYPVDTNGITAGNTLIFDGTKFTPGSGSGDMTKAVYDTDNDGVVDAAESVPWSGVTDKPSTFPPDAHTHLMTDITGGMAKIRVQRSSNQSIPSATWTELSFDTIIYESRPGSESQWSSGSPTRLICRLAGVYLVIAHVRFATNSVGTRGINLLKNGDAMVANVVHTSSTWQIHLQVSEIMLLNVGDYVFTRVYQDSGGALDVISTSNNLYLEWIRLGP